MRLRLRTTDDEPNALVCVSTKARWTRRKRRCWWEDRRRNLWVSKAPLANVQTINQMKKARLRLSTSERGDRVLAKPSRETAAEASRAQELKKLFKASKFQNCKKLSWRVGAPACASVRACERASGNFVCPSSASGHQVSSGFRFVFVRQSSISLDSFDTSKSSKRWHRNSTPP